MIFHLGRELLRFSERSNKQAAATSDIQTKANSLFNSLNVTATIN